MLRKVKFASPYLIALSLFLVLLACEEINPDEYVVLAYDTTYIQYDVHDTFTVFDTTYFDTLIFDTTYFDTLVFDTTYFDTLVFDTNYVDTLVFDTTAYDTTIWDTVFVDSLVLDTIYVPITTIQTTVLFGVGEHWLPIPSADLLSITASGGGVVDTTLYFSRADMPSYFWVTVMESGTWTLTLQAFNSDMNLLLAEASQTFTQPLISNVLTLSWEMLNELVLYDNFDTEYDGWTGTASTAILDSSLLIQSTGQTAWVYNIFDNASVGEYTALSTRFDLKFHECGYSYVGFRAHAANGSLDYGPEVIFDTGEIIAHQHSGNIVTTYQYELDTWYQLQVTMDNALGLIGRYQLEIRERDSLEYVDLGEYDYYANYGRPVDMVQISFGVAEADQGHGALQIDNVLILSE